MNINLRALEQFRVIAQEQSFTQAARRLGIAQPAVSMGLQKLERALSMELIRRDEKGFALTSEGEALLRHAEVIHRSVQNAQDDMEAIAGLKQGEVRIGIPSMLGSYFFPPILMAFRDKYPQIKLKIIEAGTRRLQEMLSLGEIDLGVIVADPIPDDLETRLLLKAQMMVTLPEDHALASQKRISFQAFLAEDLVMFKPGYFHREVVDRISHQLGLEPQITVETSLIPLIKEMVARGFAITTLLEMVIQPDDALITRPFEEEIWLDLRLAWDPKRYLTIANRAFVDFVMETVNHNRF